MDESDAMTWESLLQQATVVLEMPGSLGTGFLVAPGMVATCAHVVRDHQEVPGRSVAHGRDLTLRVAESFRDTATGLDLALLHVSELDVTPVLLSAEMRTGDQLHAFGHPAGAFGAGQHATFGYQGDATRSPDVPFPLPHAWGVPVGPGYSGSPVVNTRTGAVCGMLSTADKAGSAHLICAADIVSRLPRVREPREWLEVLADEQLAAGGWRFPSRWLRDYLAASRKAALESVRREVYVRQNVWRDNDFTLLDAGEALQNSAGNVLLTGVAGGGKSTTLRMRTVELAERWLAGDVGAEVTEVPVRVKAGALTRSGTPAEQLAAAADADVSGYLAHRLPPEVFAAEPVPGARWLVLVDGLDEITDARRRTAVLNLLRHHQNGPYRFVVTSRPLSTEDTPELDWETYELLPLNPAQLTAMTRRWFAAEGLADGVVPAFTLWHRRDSGRITPMWATMLCRLFVGRPGMLLPAGVNGLYREFVDMLRARQYAPDDPVAVQIHTALRAYGRTAVVAAEELPARIDALLPSIAAAQLANGATSPLDMIVDATRDLRPMQMRPDQWRDLVRDVARRNELLTGQTPGFAFHHQTIAEFLAAQHLATDRRHSDAEFRRIFGPARRPHVPKWLEDKDLFLIAAWAGAHPEFAAVLTRIVARHGVTGWFFIADLVSEGIDVPADVRRAASRELSVFQYREPQDRMQVAWARAMLGDPRGVDDLTALVTDRAIDDPVRVAAAVRLLELPGDHERLELLAGLAGELEPDDSKRLSLLQTLGALGDPRGADGLYAFAIDRSNHTHQRIDTADVLGDLGDHRADEVTAMIAVEPGTPNDDRMMLLARLSAVGSPRYATSLVAVANNPAIPHLERMSAANLLAYDHNGDPVETAAALAADPTYTPQLRIQAAESLIELDDPRGDLAMARIEGYPPVSREDPWADASLLGELGDAHGLDMLAAMIGTMSPAESIQPALVLSAAGDARGTDHLVAVAGGTALEDGERLLLAIAVSFRDDPRGRDLLVTMATDAGFDTRSRFTAAATLRRFDDPRYADVLTTLATDVGLDLDVRTWTASALGRLDDPRGPAELAAMAGAPHDIDHGARVRAAIALAEFTDAGDLLVALANDTGTPENRVAAANALYRHGDSRAATVLAALLTDPELADSDHIRVAGTLGRLGDTRGPDFLATFVADEAQPTGYQEWALNKLRSLGDSRVAALQSLLHD